MSKIIFIMFVICVSVWAIPSEREVAKLSQDVRAIRDLSTLDFARIASQKDECWIIAEVIPHPQVIPAKGNVKVIEKLTGNPPKAVLNYDNAVNLPDDAISGTITAIYDCGDFLYHRGGIGVCRINKVEEDNSAKVSPFLMLPTEWREFIKPAFDYVQGHASAFDPKDAKKHRKELEKLLEDKNPLLACFACRTLATGDQLNAETFVQNHLAKAKDFKQAVFTYYALRAKSGSDSITKQLIQVIDSASSAENLRTLTLGAALAKDLGITPEMLKVADELRMKYSTLTKGGGKADDYLELALPSAAQHPPASGTVTTPMSLPK